jgi:hypothetical protein
MSAFGGKADIRLLKKLTGFGCLDNESLMPFHQRFLL